MKRLAIAVAALTLLSACGHTPTGSNDEYIDEPGTLTFKIGADAQVILGAGSDADVPGLVASAWIEQQSWKIGEELNNAVNTIDDQNPETVVIIQSRLQPVDARKSGPATVEYPEFAPLLRESLLAVGEVYLLSDYEIIECCTVPMAVAGKDNMEMELKVSEAILTNVKWRP